MLARSPTRPNTSTAIILASLGLYPATAGVGESNRHVQRPPCRIAARRRAAGCAVGESQGEVPGMPDEASACLEQPAAGRGTWRRYGLRLPSRASASAVLMSCIAARQET